MSFPSGSRQVVGSPAVASQLRAAAARALRAAPESGTGEVLPSISRAQTSHASATSRDGPIGARAASAASARWRKVGMASA